MVGSVTGGCSDRIQIRIAYPTAIIIAIHHPMHGDIDTLFLLFNNNKGTKTFQHKCNSCA